MISANVFGQVDTLVTQDNVDRDSIKYVVPETKYIDLSVLTPPEGFVVAEEFNGYIHYQAGAAIILTLIEHVNYIKLSEGMTEEFFKENGLTKISENAVALDNGTKGIKYKFSFEIDEMEFVRYMVYVGDLNKTLWLNITYPKQLEELVEGEILKSLQTINLNTTRDEE